MSRNIESNIGIYTIVEILRQVIFFAPIMVLFLQANNLSMTEIMLLQSIYALATALFEVPTGYISDLLSRKIALVFSAILDLIGIYLYSISTDFISVMIAEIILALGIAMLSGANSALIYDTLKELNRKKDYKKIWGNIIFAGALSLTISNVIGGFIAKSSLRATLYYMLPFILLQVIFSLLLKEPKVHEKIKHHEALSELKDVFLGKNKVKWIIIYTGIIFGTYQLSLWLYQPYFKVIGLPIEYFGIVFAIFQLTAGTISKFTHVIEEKLGKKRSLYLIAILIPISYFLMGNIIFLFSFMFGIIHQFIRGFLKIVSNDYINELAPSKVRATILSMNSLFRTICYAIIMPFVGLMIDGTSLIYTINMLGIITVFTGIFSVGLLKIKKVI